MKRKLLLLVAVTAWCVSVFAQQRTITGTVTSQEDGKPIPGASVRATGTNAGAQTDVNGKYALPVNDDVKTIEIFYVGFVKKIAPIGNSNVINAVLEADIKGLSEVRVVGYGSTRSVKEINGAITKVKGSEISAQPAESFDKALSGKAAGVQISSSGGTLADGVSIRIRGANSISTSSLPLIVIDGVPTNSLENLSLLNGGNGTRFNPLALLNSSDIESIEVLKDAGASVIYGSRAANGVILVTTKKGKAGSASLSFNSRTNFATASKMPDLLNPEQFNLINNEKATNRYGAAVGVIAKDSDIDQDGKPDRVNWNDYIFRTGKSYDNSLSLSGGSEKATYYASLRYADQQGILYGNNLTTGAVRANIEVKPTDWIRSGIEISYVKSKNKGVLTDRYLTGSALAGFNAAPTVSPFNPTGPKGYNLTTTGTIGYLGLGNNITSYQGTSFIGNRVFNPIATIDLQRNDLTPQALTGNVYMEVQPIRGLKLTSKFGVDNQSNFEDQYSHPLIGSLGNAFNGLIQDINYNINQWIWQNFVTFDKLIATKHKFSMNVGTEYQFTKQQAIYTYAADFADPFFNNIISGTFANNSLGADGLLSSNGLESYFGRLAYSFQNRYFVEGAVRADAYSEFGSNNKWGTFPSLSLGWLASQEDFLAKYKFIDNLKIRGSYGQVGNSRGVPSYASLTLYSGGNYTTANGFSYSQLGNQDLRWETSKKLNVGFDANIFANRIGLTVDYFTTDISGLILAAPVLHTSGIPNSSIISNIGSMRNSGIEFTLNTNNIKKDNFSWNSSFNFTRIKNRVTGLVATNNNADIVAPNANAVASVGRPLGTYKFIQWAGVDPQTGYPMWYGADGVTKKIWNQQLQKYTLENGTQTSLGAADQVYLEGKSGMPKWYGGLDNNFTYKNWDLNLALVFQGGNYIYNQTLASLMVNTFQNNEARILDRWTTPGQVTDVPRLNMLDQTANQASSRFLEKGDFLRMRTISLGYTLPNALAKRLGISNLRAAAQLHNAFVITGYSGVDPEINFNRNSSNIAVGYDNRSIPQPRTYSLNLSVTL